MWDLPSSRNKIQHQRSLLQTLNSSLSHDEITLHICLSFLLNLTSKDKSSQNNIISLILTQLNNLRIFNQFSYISMTNILLNMFQSLMQVMTVNEKRSVPHPFKLEIGIHQIVYRSFFNFIKFNCISWFCLAFWIFFVCEIVCVQNATNTSDQMEVFKFVVSSESFLDWTWNQHYCWFNSSSTSNQSCSLSLLSQFRPSPNVTQFLLVQHAEQRRMSKNFIESHIFQSNKWSPDAQ